MIFIDVPKQNGKLRELQQEIYRTFREKEEYEMGLYDPNIHFHATVCRKDIKAKFSEIWNFISKIDINLKTTCNNIAILELKHGTWKIHKEFKIN